jgi:RNA polymerase sigma-70 factor (ECF subfamily)
MTDGPVPISRLLEHRDGVRRLARSLVRGEADADDLEQDAWLAALRRPPRHAGSPRAWLAAVTRNLAFNRRRATARRAAHERAAAGPDAARSPSDVVAEADAHRRLVVAVMGLAEPYRSTVLLRFLEDLPPGEVARVQGVPVETVRTRLRRALGTLRAALAGDGAGGAWLAALAPLGLLSTDAGPAASASTATTTAAAATATGGTIMAAKATIAGAAVLSLAAGFAGGALFGVAGERAGTSEVAGLAERLEALEARATRGGASDAGTAPPSLTRSPSAASSPSGGRAAPGDGSDEDLGEKLRALEAELAAARRTSAELVAWASGLGPAPRDAEAERRPWDAMSDEELLAEIRRLSNARGKSKDEDRLLADRAIDAGAVFLARTTEALARAEVLHLRGFVWLRTGEVEKAEAAQHDALRLTDMSTHVGVAATVQLAFAASARKDDRRAAELLFGVGRRPGAALAEQAWARFIASTYLKSVDGARAREELRALVAEHGASEDKGVRHWVDSARKELERIEKGEASR